MVKVNVRITKSEGKKRGGKIDHPRFGESIKMIGTHSGKRREGGCMGGEGVRRWELA